MRLVLAAIGAIIVAALGVLLSGATSGADVATDPAVWVPTPGLPFAQPAQLYAKHNGKGPGMLSVALEATTGAITVSGRPVHAHGFAFHDLDAAPLQPDPPVTLDGPTLHVRPGDRIHVQFTNMIGKDANGNLRPTNIHYHGLHVSPVGLSDNIFRTFDGGKTYQSVVDLIKTQPVGTYWYHVHMHGDSNGQVMGGLSGMLIIEGLRSTLPKPWHKVHSRQLALRDVQTVGLIPNPDYPSTPPDPPVPPIIPGVGVGLGDTIADLAVPPAQAQPSTRLVNALYQPVFMMQAKHYELWNLANIGSNAYYYVALRPEGKPDEHVSMTVVAEDGLPAWKAWNAPGGKLLMPPGKRFDVLVRVPDEGKYQLMSLVYAQSGNQQLPCDIDPTTKQCAEVNGGDGPNGRPGTAQVLATINAVGTKSDGLPDATTIPGHPYKRAHEDLADVPIHGNCSDAHPVADEHQDKPGENCDRTFTFAYNPNFPPQYAMINNTVFSAGMVPLAAPYVGTVEEWKLLNTTNDDHPFHIHVNGFQVMASTAITPDNPEGKLKRVTSAETHGHQDIVSIPKRQSKTIPGEVIIRQKFSTYTGWFVFHCHILQHEDAGMMATIQVRHRGETIRPAPDSVGATPHGMVNEAAGMYDDAAMSGMAGMPGM